jgi:hypothetical protein
MLTVQRIRELFGALDEELARRNIRGEIFLAGGAVMCLVYRAREATKDIDALLMPAADLRGAASAVAGRFSEHGGFEVFEELSHLRVYVPHPEYLFAMKCLALRLGEEFQDYDDVRVLVRALRVRTAAETEAILGRYYALERYPDRARYVLEELLTEKN